MEIEKSIEIMKSLADTSRLRVLNSLMDKPRYVEEIAVALNLAASTVSFHLKKLEKAGLIKKTKDQYYIIYGLNEDILNLSLRELTSFNNIEKFAQEERREKYRQKVLKAFMKNNKLLRLPVQKKKRTIILEEFLRKMHDNTLYTETEINDIILQHYEDYCTIRRLMIEEKMMIRENHEYRINTNYIREYF
jgi:predicted transcriptional regulator